MLASVRIDENGQRKMKKLDFNMLPVHEKDGVRQVHPMMEQALLDALRTSTVVKMDYGRINVTKGSDGKLVFSERTRKVTKKEQDDLIWKTNRFANGRMTKSTKFVEGLKEIVKIVRKNPKVVEQIKKEDRSNLNLEFVYENVVKAMTDDEFYNYQGINRADIVAKHDGGKGDADMGA